MSPRTIEPTLDAIRVFANSANSVRVFEALTDGPTTSRDLAERTGASRSTVARILDEGESREWIRSEGSRYELTDLGSVMIREFRDYVRTLEGVQHLGEAVHWLPSPARSLDFRHFCDADVITPTRPDPSEPYDYVAEAIRTATELRSLVELAMRRYVEIIDDRSEAGQLDAQVVLEASWFDHLGAESEQVPLWRRRAERNGVWKYEGDVPINLHIFDEQVVLWLGDRVGDERMVRGVLATENPTVESWAESLYEEYRAASEPLDPETLPGA
ncbi:hypothetical protein M0R89_14485 [Halorussus limi]|uniref:Uncharacterized protein n=1 Tax=Halorussus limi TaxID=2938695 RepID=A0A8U0HSF3_9EURY|nr:hypothetical protein [Halorussus limi]UPV73741.1 hypothetical protein M0R89_14485 [Halorussus limi]